MRLPQILLEYTWQVPAFARSINTRGNLAWANGDTTGYGIHADFQNGLVWPVGSVALNYCELKVAELQVGLRDLESGSSRSGLCRARQLHVRHAC